jgi:KRAB domain-containing zinc finger protein
MHVLWKFDYFFCIGVDSFLNESNLWKCPICSKLLTRQSCRSHLRIHADEKPFKCDKCDMEFRAKRSLDDHSVAHRFVGSTNPLQCRMCDKVLSSLKCLAKHEMIHTGEKPYKCEKCDKGYRTNDQLQNHVASHGDERNRLKCELCHLAYWTNAELCRHIRRRHSNQPRPMHKCHLCIKAYVKKTSLNEHIKRHEGIQS